MSRRRKVGAVAVPDADASSKSGGARGGGGNYGKYRGVEENTLAILENSTSATAHHLLDDRLAFLEAVRSASLVPQNGTAPTNKMIEPVFRILKNEVSLELIMASYGLLSELNKRYPRVYLSVTEKAETSTSSKLPSQLIIAEEDWVPFRRSEEEAGSSCTGLVDSLGLYSLIEDIADGVSKRRTQKEFTDNISKEHCKIQDLKSLRNMLLFQYLVNILEGDLVPRTHAFNENKNWNFLRESILNVVLGSRKISHKDFVKDCLFLMCDLCVGVSESPVELRANGSSRVEERSCSQFAVKLALPEVEKLTCIALKKLLLMIMDLDSSRNLAEMTRADRVRTPAAEIILDELTYDGNILSPFFLAFDEPVLKLKLIVQFFQKYLPKVTTRTRRSSNTASYETFDGILKSFSNKNVSMGINKKIRLDVTQLLLAHAFKAYLSIASNNAAEGTDETSLVEVCENMVSAFTRLKENNKGCELLQISREALFTAGTILAVEVKRVKH